MDTDGRFILFYINLFDAKEGVENFCMPSHASFKLTDMYVLLVIIEKPVLASSRGAISGKSGIGQHVYYWSKAERKKKKTKPTRVKSLYQVFVCVVNL